MSSRNGGNARIARLEAALDAQPGDLEAARDLAREALRHDATPPLIRALTALLEDSDTHTTAPLLDAALHDAAERARALYDACHTAPSRGHFILAIRALCAITPSATAWLQEILRPRPLHGWCALVAMSPGASREHLLERSVGWLEVIVPPSRLYGAFGVLSSRVSDIFSLNSFTRPLLDSELTRALDVGVLHEAQGVVHIAHHFPLPALPDAACIRCLDRKRCTACNGRGQLRSAGSGRGGFVLCEQCHGLGRCPECSSV